MAPAAFTATQIPINPNFHAQTLSVSLKIPCFGHQLGLGAAPRQQRAQVLQGTARAERARCKLNLNSKNMLKTGPVLHTPSNNNKKYTQTCPCCDSSPYVWSQKSPVPHLQPACIPVGRQGEKWCLHKKKIRGQTSGGPQTERLEGAALQEQPRAATSIQPGPTSFGFLPER